MLLSELDEVLVLDLPFLVVVVVEEHHRGLVADRAFEVVAGLDLDQPDAAIPDRVVVAKAMRLLDDHLGLHRREIRQRDDLCDRCR